MKQPSRRRYDPDRRNRIIEAALDVIEIHGVAGATHRRIAEAANVPLGSMSYHFNGLDEVFVAAFSLLAETVSAKFVELLDAAKTRDEAREAVVELICGDVWATERTMRLSYELYAYSMRNEAIRAVFIDWMARSRRALEKHFSRRTADALDTIIEGATIHNTAQPDTVTREVVRWMVLNLTREDDDG